MDKFFIGLGFNEKEIKTYLFLLSVDNASALDVAKKTGIKRPTVYLALESLLKKGMVSQTTVGKKTHYQAEPPERLETFVEQRKLFFEEQKKKLADIVPQIKSIQRESGEKPVVKYFEGKEGIVSANEELFKNKIEDYIYFAYPKDVILESFTEKELAVSKNKRIHKGIISKSLYTFKNGQLPSNSDGERYKVDENKYPLNCDIAIYGDKIRIATLKNKTSAIYIQSKDLAETLKSLFLMAFEEAKRNPPATN